MKSVTVFVVPASTPSVAPAALLATPVTEFVTVTVTKEGRGGDWGPGLEKGGDGCPAGGVKKGKDGLPEGWLGKGLEGL
jgi:hypothetical protein